MHRFLRLAMLWLIALALPVQGALAAGGVRMHATPAHATMTMPDDHQMDAASMPDTPPCHRHAVDKTGGCGACCGPIATQQALLAVAPTATRWTSLPRAAADAGASPFLTGGTDRPPRLFLA